MKMILTRDVTFKECRWLDREFKAGEIVHRYRGPTYGVIDTGVACSINGGAPFFELPRDAVQPVAPHGNEETKA